MPVLLASLLLVIWPLQAAGEGIAIRSVHRVIYGASPADGFRSPTGLALDPARGILVVADTGNHRLVFFDAAGRGRGSLAWRPAAAGAAAGEPRSVALDSRGRLYVVDGLAQAVEVTSSTGSHLGFLVPEIDGGSGTRPQSVATGASGRIYVLFSGERAGIAVLRPDGATERAIGFETAGPGTFSTPVALAVNALENRIAVADPQSAQQVKVLSAGGELVASFGAHGEGDGTFSMAVHVAWGPGDTLWIVDGIRHSIQVFDARGGWLGGIGGFGRGPGQLHYPAACALLSPDRIAVLERAGGRLQILDLDLPEALRLAASTPRSAAAEPTAREGGETP
jgi:DNA-binding beta-propeller fold protein YncE